MDTKQKKALQLGMNPSTAQGRLIKDLLFSYVEKEGCKCYHCGGDLTRDTFSIEHKVPWLDSDDPVSLFFDLENISFSHLSCNIRAARPKQTAPLVHGTTRGYDQFGCRCDACKTARSERNKNTWNTPEKRRERYLRTGS